MNAAVPDDLVHRHRLTVRLQALPDVAVDLSGLLDDL